MMALLALLMVCKRKLHRENVSVVCISHGKSSKSSCNCTSIAKFEITPINMNLLKLKEIRIIWKLMYIILLLLSFYQFLLTTVSHTENVVVLELWSLSLSTQIKSKSKVISVYREHCLNLALYLCYCCLYLLWYVTGWENNDNSPHALFIQPFSHVLAWSYSMIYPHYPCAQDTALTMVQIGLHNLWQKLRCEVFFCFCFLSVVGI